MSREEILNKLNLTTLETRRLRGYLIEAFKILRGFEDVNYQKITLAYLVYLIQN